MIKKKSGYVFILCGIVLIAASLALTAYNFYSDYKAGNSANNVLDDLSLDDQQSNLNAIPDYILNPEMDMPVIEINGYRYIGKIAVKSIDLELPVMETLSYDRLNIAPCRYAGTAYLKNMIIAGHNYRSHFGRLRNLMLDDEVIFTDVDKNVFRYSVSQIEILSDTAVGKMETGNWDLTLFTCTIGARSRVTVRCTEIKSEH